LRGFWPYILEDEAQDSSLSQEKLLRLLSNNKNWVRVGDPNQAINATFTTSSPLYMHRFMEEDGVKTTTLNESGRSGRPILDLANSFVRWVNHYHPTRELRSALLPNSIEPAKVGDPQPNPHTTETNVHIYYESGKAVTFQQAMQVVLSSLQRWVIGHPTETVAVLVPENSQGYQLAELFRRNRIAHDELLRNREPERLVANSLEIVLSYLAESTNARRLSRIYQGVWWPNHLGLTTVLRETLTPPEVQELIHQATQFITKQNRPEALFWPSDGKHSFFASLSHPQYREIERDWQLFLNQVSRWLLETHRSIEALITLIAQDIFYDPSDLALSHQFALALRSFAATDDTNDLVTCAEELRAVNNSQRRSISALNFTADFQPRAGVVTISTIHAAKGLEWDRVYLMGVNTRSFPSLQPDDILVSEKWFIRDGLNLESELTALIESALSGREYVEGEPTLQSRLDYAAERLRLLYVGITRARKELILMWDTGQMQSSGSGLTASPARPLIALHEYLSGTLSL
jgi:DNA helicase-2/ATP-dependent DNA helicase PcrA